MASCNGAKICAKINKVVVNCDCDREGEVGECEWNWNCAACGQKSKVKHTERERDRDSSRTPADQLYCLPLARDNCSVCNCDLASPRGEDQWRPSGTAKKRTTTICELSNQRLQ